MNSGQFEEKETLFNNIRRFDHGTNPYVREHRLFIGDEISHTEFTQIITEESKDVWY